MSYGLPPEIYDYYKTHILPAFLANKELDGTIKGITQDEFSIYYYDKVGHAPNFEMLRKAYISALKRAKLIRYERDKNNGQRWLIMPLVFFNDDSDMGVEEKEQV